MQIGDRNVPRAGPSGPDRMTLAERGARGRPRIPGGVDALSCPVFRPDDCRRRA